MPVIKIDVICPECGREQKYISYRKRTKNKRRKECIYCGRTFNPLDQRKGKVNKPEKDKIEGFFRFREND